MRYGIFIVSLFLSILIFVVQSTLAGDVMVVEASIFKSETTAQVVSIQVPDYLSFGDISEGTKSNELKVYVNNTGTVDLSVTPTLLDYSEKIFNYTYFRSTKTHNNTSVPFTKIGAFSFNVTKDDDAYFYMTLDLTNYPGAIEEDLIRHQAEIKFLAMSR